jgi:pimeloyl-ACP methyl ester carboxylesterase
MIARTCGDRELGRYHHPLAFIYGVHDLPLFTRECAKVTVEAWFERCEAHIRKDAGHCPIQETSVLAATLLDRFLAAHS